MATNTTDKPDTEEPGDGIPRPANDETMVGLGGAAPVDQPDAVAQADQPRKAEPAPPPGMSAREAAALIEAGVVVDTMMKGYASRYPGLSGTQVMRIFARQMGFVSARYMEILQGTLKQKIDGKQLVLKEFNDAVNTANLMMGQVPMSPPSPRRQ